MMKQFEFATLAVNGSESTFQTDRSAYTYLMPYESVIRFLGEQGWMIVHVESMDLGKKIWLQRETISDEDRIKELSNAIEHNVLRGSTKSSEEQDHDAQSATE